MPFLWAFLHLFGLERSNHNNWSTSDRGWKWNDGRVPKIDRAITFAPEAGSEWLRGIRSRSRHPHHPRWDYLDSPASAFPRWALPWSRKTCAPTTFAWSVQHPLQLDPELQDMYNIHTASEWHRSSFCGAASTISRAPKTMEMLCFGEESRTCARWSAIKKNADAMLALTLARSMSFKGVPSMKSTRPLYFINKTFSSNLHPWKSKQNG